MVYDIDAKIGKKFKIDTVKTSSITVSGTVTSLPETSLGRRDYIKVTNVGGVEVEILSSANQSVGDGYPLAASGGEFEAETNATLYIVSTGAASELRVFERATKIGK